MLKAYVFREKFEGSQRSFITEVAAMKLNLKPINVEYIAVAPFGATRTTAQHLAVSHVNVETESGDQIPITALVVPFIAAPLLNSMRTSINTFTHLQGLKLAHPITNQ